MHLDRREFLKAAGGIGLILGLPSLALGQNPQAKCGRAAVNPEGRKFIHFLAT